MFCIKCGKQIPNNSLFCMYCGASVTFTSNAIGFWNDYSHENWLAREGEYWNLINDKNKPLEIEMENLNGSQVADMTGQEFYDFLYSKYFAWKFTAQIRLAQQRKHLVKHTENIDELNYIKEQLFSFDLTDIKAGLKIATQIKGLGYAGGSGLLSILFPQYFGTVDQFVCKKMQGFGLINPNVNPDNLSLKASIEMIQLMRKKAIELNERNNVEYWTPRKIDKVLWCLDRL